jgi:hypothetical protein
MMAVSWCGCVLVRLCSSVAVLICRSALLICREYTGVSLAEDDFLVKHLSAFQ